MTKSIKTNYIESDFIKYLYITIINMTIGYRMNQTFMISAIKLNLPLFMLNISILHIVFFNP